jgi:hypothetical protein
MILFTSVGAATSHAAPQSVDNTTSDAQRMMMMILCSGESVSIAAHHMCACVFASSISRILLKMYLPNCYKNRRWEAVQIVTKTDGGKLCTHALGLELAPGEGAHTA